LLCSESAWLVAASVCLYDADAAAAVTSAVCCTEQRYQQRTLKSGTPFVVIGGLKSLCLTDENTYAPLEVDVSSWKRRVKKHLSIAKATYRQSEVPSANTRTTRSLENGANALLDEHQHSSTTMVLDHVAQDQYCEDDMIQENTVTSEPARALIQSLTVS